MDDARPSYRAPSSAWRVGRDGIRRPLIARATIGFWSVHDADLWVNQRLLVGFVRGVVPGVDKDTVRSVFESMQRGGILIRRKPTATRILYRVAALYADPTAPGYAREVDEILKDPLPWVSAHGHFFRIGRPSARSPWMFPVAAFPHHFTKHLWMRSWLRCAARGLFARPEEGLAAAVAAARWAPIRLLWEMWDRRDSSGAVAEAGRLFATTRLWRETRRMRPDDAPPAGAPEAAIRLLHEFCGHAHLAALLGRPVLGLSRGLFVEEFVQVHLDRLIAGRLRQRAMVPGAGLEVPGPRIAFPIASDALVNVLESNVRAMDPSLRETLGEHRRAFPVGPMAPKRRVG